MLQVAEHAAGDLNVFGCEVANGFTEGEGDGGALTGDQDAGVAGNGDGRGRGVDREGGDGDAGGHAAGGDVEHRGVGAVGQFGGVGLGEGPVAVGVHGDRVGGFDAADVERDGGAGACRYLAVECGGAVPGEVVTQSAAVVACVSWACGGECTGDAGVGDQREVVVEICPVGVAVACGVGELVAGHLDGGAGAGAVGREGGGPDFGVGGALHQGAQGAARDQDVFAAEVGAVVTQGEGDGGLLARGQP